MVEKTWVFRTQGGDPVEVLRVYEADDPLVRTGHDTIRGKQRS